MSVDYFLVGEASGRTWTERILWSAVGDRHDVDLPLRWVAALLTWLDAAARVLRLPMAETVPLLYQSTKEGACD